MANNFYAAIALTGGGTGALDAIDGTDLADLDSAFVVTADSIYIYSLDADSSADENSPAVISPDANAGTKRWILVRVVGGSSFTSNTISSTPTTLTVAQCVQYVHYVTNTAATTVNLPAVSTVPNGAVLVVYMKTAYVLTIDPNAADRIVLNGVALDDGDKIISSGYVGDYVTLQKDSADGWTVIGRSGYWSDGGA